MQGSLSLGQFSDLQSVRDCLRSAFGAVRDGERLGATAQFVFAFIASRTYDRTSWKAFERLTARYSKWDEIADAPAQDIEAALGDVTFPDKKARDLKCALQKIRVRAGAIDLDFLGRLPVETAIVWLEQIHGVGRKIAAATLNFSSLRRRSVVVDTHVARVLKRFGLVSANAATEDIYNAVMAVADGFNADDLYELHWLLKTLGQKHCTHLRALCASCPLADLCMQRVEEGAVRAVCAA